MRRAVSYLVLLVLLLNAMPAAALAEVTPQEAGTGITYYSQPQKLAITLPEYTLEEGEFTVSPLEDMEDLIAAVNRPVVQKKGLMRTALKTAVNDSQQAAPESITGYAAFDIKLTDEAARAKAYSVPVVLDTPIDLLAGQEAENVSIVNVSYTLYHFAEDGSYTEVEEIKAEREENLLTGFSFTTEGFSSFLLKYTVDFTYETDDGKSYELSLTGGDCVALGALTAALGIVPGEQAQAFSLDIVGAEFSAPDLAYVGRVEADTTVGAFKDALGLACEYSAVLTEADIAAINGRPLAAGEWVLISLKPFLTEQTLTITMADGRVYTVQVTDAQIKTTVMTKSGEAYDITVIFEKETGIPEDAVLVAEELLPGAEGYSDYVARSEEALGMDAGSAEYIRMFDIKIVDKDDPAIKYQPAKGTSVDVRIELADKDTSKEAEENTQVVHFANENDSGSLVNAEINGQTVSFAADGFSLYAIVGTVIEKNVLASDGKNYKVTVTYGAETGIPSDAELAVEELLPDENDVASTSSVYDEYVSKTENALGMEEGSAGYIRLFDIKIVDKDDHSVKYQPAEGTAVDVRIELADSESENLSVVHFADGAEDTGSVVEAKTSGQIVTFAAEGFSVYSVVSRESAAGNTDLDGKTYVLVANNNALLMGTPLASDAGKLAAISANPTVGSTLQVSGSITMWTFEAVSGQPGWYYISDGNGNYLNITSASGNGGTVTLGARQPIYVASKGSGDSITYQLRNGETQNGSKAVNNYGNNWSNGFGAWTSSNANNDWFRFYDMELLGDYSVSFSANGGTGAVPSPIWGLAGDSVILPDYSGTRTGYTFLGWSTGSNLVNKDYYPVYPAGSAYTLPDKNTTLYAVWTAASPAQGQFFIRLDGTIPYEPDQYDSSAYTSAINITGAIRNQVWVTDNDVFKYNNGLYIENDVTANLNQVPNVDQLVSNINGSSGKLGFKVQNMNGEIVVSEITNAATNRSNYNVSVGNALYVLWYVQKYAGTWHVDGTLLVKDKVNISYVGNAPDGSVKNVPLGYQEDGGTEVTIGASGGKNGPLRTPTRPGYIFLGWNLKADGSGTWYNNGDSYTLNEDTTLYAQWSKGTNMMTVAKMNEDGETLAGAQFKLEEKTAAGAFIEKANRTTGTNGTFTYDMMENDTLYRMTETYAPNGYEVQNSFYFKVAVAESGSSDLKLRVCDENGNYIETPEWLQIDYLPADDPGAQGVARIQFHIKDERIQRNFTFIKVDEEGNPLPGAEYTLTNAKGTVSGVLKEQSGSDGVFSVENAVLPYGTYTLTESRPPVTFAANEPVIFTLNDYVSESENGLTINEDRSGSVIEADCEVSSVTEQGLTVTTYAYTIKVQDIRQAHIIVTKDVAIDGDLNPQDLDTTIYYALTKKGEEGYVKKENGELWIERMDIVNGVPTPEQVVFDGVDFGEYDVWEMALIGGEYTRMYSGLVVADNFQLDSVAASSADGGNNANVSDSDLEARVEFTNHYGKITQSTSFIANKRWTKRDGTTIVAPPEHAVIEFTLYSEKKDASGQIIDGTLEEVRSIVLDGVHDPDGEDTPWTAVFKYLPVYDENNLEYVYKVKETVTVDGYYPNEYPQEYYLTSSGGTITNRELKTDVELHKHFEIYPENADLPGAAEGLAFTLTLPDQTTQSFTLADFAPSAEESNDYVLTLHDLPLGAYSFTEAGQENLFSEAGYNLIYSVSSAEGEAEVGSPQEQPVLQLELQNNYAKSGMLIVRKNSILHEAVDETTVPEEISGKEFPFVVRRGSLYLQENGTLGTTPYVFTLTEGTAKEFASVPAGQYTVIEQDSTVEGYLWEVIDGTRAADGTWSKTLTISDAEDAGEASFDNRYTKIENGSLTVSKTVAGGPEEAGTKAYEVEIKTTRHQDETVWLDADGNLTTEKTILSVTAGQPLVFPTVPAGTYTVTENETDAAFTDYALQVTYSKESPFTIHKDGQEEVQITNTYNYLYTPVKITKTVTGNMGDKNLYFGFDAYVTDAEDQPVVVEGVTNSNGLIQFSLKDGEEKLLEKLPKGAKLRIVEYNENYETTISGKVGVGENVTETDLTAAEVHSEAGAETTVAYSFVIPDEGATVDFTNDRTVEQTVILKKIGYNNTDDSTWDLAGATFRIYEDEEKTKPVVFSEMTEFTSGEDGVIYAGKLEAGTYYLDETSVPAGYNAPVGLFVLNVGVDGISLNSTAVIGSPDLNSWITSEESPETGEVIYTVSIRNTTGVSLPSTGGPGTALYAAAGLSLMGIALWMLLRRKKQTA